MIQVTKQQRANAVEARDVMWPSVPPENVVRDLAYWRFGGYSEGDRTPDCGTVACFGGWCAWWPSFQAQGVLPSRGGSPNLRNGGNAWAAAMWLFGDSLIFSSRGTHLADTGLPVNTTDHEIVTNRLNWLIENSEVIDQ